jgi:hypothetical protein
MRAPTQDFSWHVDFPGQAHDAEGADQQISHVQFPPAKSVPGRAGERVVIVVPALAQAHDCHPVRSKNPNEEKNQQSVAVGTETQR